MILNGCYVNWRQVFTAKLKKQEDLCKSAPPRAAVSLDLRFDLNEVTRTTWPFPLIVCWAVVAKP